MDQPLAETLELDDPRVASSLDAENPLPEVASTGAPSDPAGLLERISATLEQLHGNFLTRAAQDTFRERQIDRLHAEVQDHRADLLGQLERPVLLGLIRLHDDLGRTVEALRRRDPETLTVATVFAAFEGFQEDIELLLGEHQVERYETPDPRFDPKRQTAVRTVLATLLEEAGGIAGRVRPGFVRGDFILQKERVAVFAAAVKPSNLESGAES